jgi:NAD+ synthase
MPAADSDPQDEEDARAVAAHLGIETVRRPIGTIVAGAVAALAGTPDARMLANVKARARMLVLYAEAVQRNRLVAGTGNKSELLVGYFTKYGDGGVDVQPIGDLYKTQVFELARWLEVPERIRAKAPSAGLWPGQTDEDELGIRYEELDVILKGIELNASVPEVARRTGLSLEQVARVETMVRRSEHKRRPPLVPKLGARTIGIDWRRPVHWDA